MSALVHCDGPDCTETMRVGDSPRLCDPGWIHVEEPGIVLDFHNRRCLAAWSSGEASTNKRRVDGL